MSPSRSCKVIMLKRPCISLTIMVSSFLCQLTDNNISKSTRPRDMLFVLKDTLSMEDDES